MKTKRTVAEPNASYMPFKVQYVVNGKGQKTHVQIDLRTFERIVDDLEMLEDIRAYDAAKADAGDSIPLEKYQAERKARDASLTANDSTLAA